MDVTTYFTEADFQELPPSRQLAVAWRAIQRGLPLYPRRWANILHDPGVPIIERTLLLCKEGMEDRYHPRQTEAIHEMAANAFHRTPDSARSGVLLACSETCWAMLQYAGGRRHTTRRIANNIIEAAARTLPGSEQAVRQEVADDLTDLRELSTKLVLPGVESMFPLWRRKPPAWYLDANGGGLLWSAQQESLEGKTTIGGAVTHVRDQLLAAVARDPDLLHQLSHRRFEEVVAKIWEGLGYEVGFAAHTSDQGRDVIAVQRTLTRAKYLIECKKVPRGHDVDIQAVRALWWTRERNHVSKAIMATTGRFTGEALREFQQHVWQLDLRDFDGLVDWLNLWKRSQDTIWVPRETDAERPAPAPVTPPQTAPVEHKPLEVFVCYAPEDTSMFRDFERHVAPLVKARRISLLHEGAIAAGAARVGATADMRARAGLVVCLVSASFIASTQADSLEASLLARRQDGAITPAVAVILSACLWDDTAFGQLRALPDGRKPISAWPDQNAAWLDVARGIQATVHEIVNAQAR